MPTEIIKRAILLSGGIDSCCLAYWKKPEYAFFIDYGQKPAKAELRASQMISQELQMKYEIIDIDCSSIGSGDLTGKRNLKLNPATEWWPYRNQLLITFALMKAVSRGVKELIIGSVKTDKRHKDGTKDFIELISKLSTYQEGNIRIVAPGIDLTSDELVKISETPASLIGWTHSCHKSNIPCGKCNGCSKHIYIKKKSNLFK